MDTDKWACLLQPYKDLAENWNIDIDKELESFIDDLLAISDINSPEAINFAQAAVILHGSSAIYSRKVEFLHNLMYITLSSMIDDDETHIKTSSSRKSTSSALPSSLVFDPSISTAKPHSILLSPQQESELLLSGFLAHTNPRLPLLSSSIDPDNSNPRQLLNSHLCSMEVSDSGQLLLSHWDNDVLLPITNDEDFSILRRSICPIDDVMNDVIPMDQSFNGFDNDNGGDNGGDLSDLDDGFAELDGDVEEKVGEEVSDEFGSFGNNKKSSRLQNLNISENFAISNNRFFTDFMDPDDTSSFALGKRQPYKPLAQKKYQDPPKIKQGQDPRDWLAEFEEKPRPARNLQINDMTLVNSLKPLIASFKRTVRDVRLQQESLIKYGELLEDTDDEGGDSDGERQVEVKHQNEQSRIDGGNMDLSLNQSMIELSKSGDFDYSARVQSFLMEAEARFDSTVLSALAKKVNNWQEEVLPLLAEQEASGPFVVEQYSDRILQKIENIESSEVDAEFLLNDSSTSEVARNFATLLHLVNSGYFTISKTQSNEVDQISCIDR
ncbi:hypothetical protein GEMRC1_013637 [Eukaryota sp. GEM-RC1]